MSINVEIPESRLDWHEYRKSDRKPRDIPNDPAKSYAKYGWVSWGEFLGTGHVSAITKSKNYLPFQKAREEVRKLAKKCWKFICQPTSQLSIPHKIKGLRKPGLEIVASLVATVRLWLSF